MDGGCRMSNKEGKGCLTLWLCSIVVLFVASWMSDVIWGRR